MKEQIEVTVLMSMYNTPLEQLKESIESILNQTYTEFEFLIIDDAAKKECVDLVKSYNDNRIRLVQNEKNIGLENSLNKGLKIAKGKYIVRMDTDDIAINNRIETQLDFAKKHPEYSIIGSKAEYFNENGAFGENKKVGEVFKEDFILGTPFVHPTLMIKKEDILRINGYPLYRRCEDYAMEMEMYSNGYKGYIIDQVLMRYRLDNSSYKKKKNKHRITEMKIKYKYFKKLKIKRSQYIYILKPLVTCIIPKRILEKYHKIKLSRKEKIS